MMWTYWEKLCDRWQLVVERDKALVDATLLSGATVSHLSVWDRELSEKEIAALAAGAIPTQMGAKEFYPLPIVTKAE